MEESEFIKTTKDLARSSLNGIIEIQGRLGYLEAKKTPEYKLFTDTLVAAMVCLKKSGINPFEKDDG